MIRNEVGVIEQPEGQRFYVAVFTRSDSGANAANVNTAIGRAAAAAVEYLSG